jgi:hypothetical protein
MRDLRQPVICACAAAALDGVSYRVEPDPNSVVAAAMSER